MLSNQTELQRGTRRSFESEFFGHVRGAFTGAHKDKSGRFELADGGTLFLDEIGEVPLAMQAKLLRVLQEQALERLGCDTRTRKVNGRVIAASNRNLKMEVEERRFRLDLFLSFKCFSDRGAIATRAAPGHSTTSCSFHQTKYSAYGSSRATN
jgi:DNA-binding NtrC family response regulator